MKITSNMEQYLYDNQKNQTQKELANHLGGNITEQDIQYWLRKHNLYKKKNMFLDDDILFMKTHYKDMTYKEIAEKLGFTERQIRGKINNMKLSKLRKFQSNYFDVIDTDLKAYYLGFIYADGQICYSKEHRTYEFGMELQSGDRYILDTLNSVLGGCHLITHKDEKDIMICGKMCHQGESDTIRIFSHDIVMGLKNNGIETNKTMKDIFPHVNDSLFYDFLRGYIDGDGCFYINKNKYIYMNITSATFSAFEYIQKRLLSDGITTNIYKENDRKYRLMCTDSDSMKILVNKLYHKDYSLCLVRKYNVIKSYLIGFANQK